MTVAEQLKAARALIADAAHWCRHTYARAGNNHAVDPIDHRARRFCAQGAMRRVGADEAALRALWYAAIDLYNVATVAVNDMHGHAAVIAAFDRAIADEEGC